MSVLIGSALTAAVEPSCNLFSMGLSDDDAFAFASIRFSLGRFNSENEIISLVNVVLENL